MSKRNISHILDELADLVIEHDINTFNITTTKLPSGTIYHHIEVDNRTLHYNLQDGNYTIEL